LHQRAQRVFSTVTRLVPWSLGKEGSADLAYYYETEWVISSVRHTECVACWH
jgi:hypothetical protein